MTPTDVMRLPMFDVVQKLSPALSNPATMAGATAPPKKPGK